VKRFQQVGLARSVGTRREDDARLELQLEGVVRPEVAKRDLSDDQPLVSPGAGSA
jgi:hypothetical protein